MARPGVTYAEVAEAATQLVGQNKNPTIEQVRLILGSGSSTTIANHLRQWKEGQQGTSLIAAKENIPPELIAIVKGLWDRVLEQAEEKINSIEITYQQSLAETQEELQKYKHNNQRWQQLFNQWTREKEQLTTDKMGIEQALALSQKNHDALETKQQSLIDQLQERQDRIAELQRLHANAQANLEHYRETVREQRLTELQQFEQQKQALQLEVKALKEEAVINREKTSTLQQQYHSLQQAHAVLEKAHTKLIADAEKQQAQLMESEKAKTEFHQASQHWQNQYKDTQKTLENKTTQLIDSQTQLKVLEKQFTAAQSKAEEMLDQNKLLSHEKWVLGQEKAQLQGQLKQMQEMISA